MKKKGFTLAELIGVVVLLGAILLIIIPVVSKSLKDGKQQLYDTQIENIKKALETWATENKPKNNETYYLTLSQLKKEGLVEHELKNPINEEYFANDMVLKVINNNGIINYEVLEDTGTCKSNYSSISKFFDFDNIVYVEINSTYEDIKPVTKDNFNNILDVEVINNNVNTSLLGSYYITYSSSIDNKCNSVIKTVVVTDTISPVISFNGDLEIKLSDIGSYDLLKDVTITDNSNIEPIVEVSNNFAAIKGTYTVKYTATDSLGNSTTRLRKVIVK